MWAQNWCVMQRLLQIHAVDIILWQDVFDIIMMA